MPRPLLRNFHLVICFGHVGSSPGVQARVIAEYFVQQLLSSIQGRLMAGGIARTQVLIGLAALRTHIWLLLVSCAHQVSEIETSLKRGVFARRAKFAWQVVRCSLLAQQLDEILQHTPRERAIKIGH